MRKANRWAALGASILLIGCRSPDLFDDYDGVDKDTAHRLVGGEADLAAFYLNGILRITKPEVKDELGFRDLDELQFGVELDRLSKLPWPRTPSAVVIYFNRGSYTEHGFPPETWARLKKMIGAMGFRPVLLIYESPTFGPTIGVGYPYRGSPR